MRSYIKVIQIIQKCILWTFGGVLIIIKCSLKIDLIMSDFENVSSFFTSFSTSSMYSMSVSVKIFSELTELHHTLPLDPHCLLESHHPSIPSPPTCCSHPLISAHACLHCLTACWWHHQVMLSKITQCFKSLMSNISVLL